MNRHMKCARWCAVSLGLCLLSVAGCSKGEDTGQPAASPVSGADGFAIGFRSEPDPPHSGKNDIEVTVNGPNGAPVTDATVTVVFSMPAMPSMNMPAMRSETTLAHDAEGRYRGAGELEMGGTWNVSVLVSRGSEEVGNRKLSIVAK